MTGSAAYQAWLRAGQPDSGLALPLAQLRDVLRGAGYTVYDRPNAAHLQAIPPEDHTPFSATGYPGSSPRWWRHAIDVMPRSGDAAGARDLWLLGARIAGHRNAGLITWLKYINRPPVADLGRAVQDSWQPGHAQRGSSDTGHLHLSSVTGVETLSAPYNPLIAIGVDAMTHTVDQIYDTMVSIAAGGQPTAGGSVEVPNWIKTMQGYGPKLDALSTKLDTVIADLAAIKTQIGQSPVGGQGPTGDVQVTGTLHLG